MGRDVPAIDPAGDEIAVLRRIVPDLAPAVTNELLLLPSGASLVRVALQFLGFVPESVHLGEGGLGR